MEKDIMTKYKFNKIAKQYGLTFKEAINLVAIKGEIDRNIKYEGIDNMCLNYDMSDRQLSKIESLHDKEFIKLTNGSVKLLESGQQFPLHIGVVSYLGGFDDEDILENVKIN